MSETLTIKPFLKWAGGKGQLLAPISKQLDLAFKNQNLSIYAEPFIGSGAVMFHALQTYKNIETVIINDLNEDLILTYETIRDAPTRY